MYTLQKKKLHLKHRIIYSTSTGDGWGAAEGYLPSNQRVVFVSDGSCFIHVWDATSLKEISRKCIQDPFSLSPLTMINELEYVHGHLFANLWGSNKVAVIDWNKGEVVKFIDFSYLQRLVKIPQDSYSRANAVLNGIAYDEEKNELYLTGKLWNRMFRVELFE